MDVNNPVVKLCLAGTQAEFAGQILTVASYNLQHPAQFTEDALAGLRQQLMEHLDHGLPVAEIRQRVSRLTEGHVKVLRPEAERRAVLRRWPMTIADVYIPAQPVGAARIRDEFRQ